MHRVIGQRFDEQTDAFVDDITHHRRQAEGLDPKHPLAAVFVDRGHVQLLELDSSPVWQSIVHEVMCTCSDLYAEVIPEGIEQERELATLRRLCVRVFQGFLFARPAFESLPDVTWPTSA